MEEQIDFREILQVEPGRELDVFFTRLRDVLTLNGYLNPPFSEKYVQLDKAYREHLSPEQQGDFNALARKLESAMDFNAWQPDTEKKISLGGGWGAMMHISDKGAGDDDEPEDPYQVNFMSGFWGAGDQKRGLEHIHWLGHPDIRKLLAFLMLEARRQGFVIVPSEWTAGNIAIYGSWPFWSIYVRDGIAYYESQNTPVFEALRSYLGYLVSKEDSKKMASFYLYDEIMFRHAQNDFGGTIDGIALLDELPDGDHRIERSIQELLESPNSGVRTRIAELAGRHPYPKLRNQIYQLAMKETAHLAVIAYIKALRLMGGEESFDLLFDIARGAASTFAAYLGNRALAWVESCPDTDTRLSALCRSKKSKDRRIGVNALNERKHYSILAFGKELATDDETDLFENVKAFVQEHANESQIQALNEWFAKNRIGITKISSPTGLVQEAQIVSGGGVPIISDKEHPEKFCKMLGALEAVCIENTIAVIGKWT